jgi:hypothetical protein
VILLKCCFIGLFYTSLISFLLQRTYSWHFVVRVPASEIIWVILITVAAFSLFETCIRVSVPISLILAFLRHLA